MNKLIPFGMKTAIFQIFVDDLIEIFEAIDTDKRDAFVGAIMQRRKGARFGDIFQEDKT